MSKRYIEHNTSATYGSLLSRTYAIGDRVNTPFGNGTVASCSRAPTLLPADGNDLMIIVLDGSAEEIALMHNALLDLIEC